MYVTFITTSQSFDNSKGKKMFGFVIFSLFLLFSEITCHIIGQNFTQDQKGSRQTVWCFEQFDGYGLSLMIQNPIRDLSDNGWNDRISSCKFTGFWLLYEDRDYNKYYPNVSFEF